MLFRLFSDSIRKVKRLPRTISCQQPDVPLEGASILDVGGGIGVIDMELADCGVGSAAVVEASPAYFEVARSEVETRYGSRPTQFLIGDFAAMAPTTRAGLRPGAEGRFLEIRRIGWKHLPSGYPASRGV